MITVEESGLSAAEYSALQSSLDNHTFELIAHRYNLSFEELTTNTGVASNTGADFAVAVSGSSVYRLSGSTFEKLNTANNTWAALPYTAPSSPLNTPPALVFRDGALHVYVATETGIYTNSTSDDGVNWAGWTHFYGGTQNYYIQRDLLPTYDASKILKSSEYNDGYYTYQATAAFDRTENEWIWVASSPTGYIGYDFGAGNEKIISRFSITFRGIFLDQNPKTFKLEYSSDGSSWTQLEPTWAAPGWVNSSTGWLADGLAAGETRSYQITPVFDGPPPITAKRYWRINITSNHGSTLLALNNIYFYDTIQTTGPDVVQIAAPRWDRIHAVYLDQTRQLHNPRVIRWDRGEYDWVVDESEIWWTFRFDSFDVANLDEVDVIVAATEIPGTLHLAAQDNDLVKYIYTSGGIVSFKYQYGTWSDHFDVEIIDNMEAWRYRKNILASTLNGKVYVTALAEDGSQSYRIKGRRMYSSADGRFWSNGNFMPLPDGVSDDALKLVLVGNWLYAFQRQKVYRSAATLAVDVDNPALKENVTPYVAEYNLSHDGAFQSAFVLDNSAGHFTNHAFITADNVIWFTHKSGIWVVDEVNGGYRKLLVQVGRTQLDSIEKMKSLPEEAIRVSTRDILAKITDYSVSEQARYWKTQLVGADNFSDAAGGNYGGLSHTATQSGAHKTRLGWLEVDTDNEEAVAFSTFQADVWNGSAQIGFQLQYGGTGQYAGICFRALDYNNMWYVVYEQATDTVKLFTRRNGVSSQPAYDDTSTSMSWTGWSITRYIRVEFRYGLIRVYTSSESAVNANDGGRVWTLAIEHKMNCTGKIYGAPYLKQLLDTPIERGYLGEIGKGKL